MKLKLIIYCLLDRISINKMILVFSDATSYLARKLMRLNWVIDLHKFETDENGDWKGKIESGSSPFHIS